MPKLLRRTQSECNNKINNFSPPIPKLAGQPGLIPLFPPLRQGRLCLEFHFLAPARARHYANRIAIKNSLIPGRVELPMQYPLYPQVIARRYVRKVWQARNECFWPWAKNHPFVVRLRLSRNDGKSQKCRPLPDPFPKKQHGDNFLKSP